MVGRILRQTDSDLISLHTFQQTLHKLGAPTVVLWAIVQIDEERLDVGKTFSSGLPPIDQAIHQTIAGHFGCHPIQKQLIGGWEENSHWRDRGCGVKIMIGGFGGHATFPPTCKGANLDRRLRIHRES